MTDSTGERKHLTTPQLAKVLRLLDENYDTEAGRYKADWTDQKIASEIGCHYAAVSRRRIGMYGHFKTATPKLAPEVSALMQRVAALESRLEQLENAVTAPRRPA